MLLHIFKRLGKVADEAIVKMVYFSLCQSILGYCIVSWGSAAKSHMMKIERAQRALLKVAYRRPYRYRTNLLYAETKVLRVRQLYILSTTMRFHKTSHYGCRSQQRSSRLINWDRPYINKPFGRRSFAFMGPYLYTKLNKSLKILKQRRKICSKVISLWLLNLDYEKTEDVLKTCHKKAT
ncbi:hypothetical protein PYW08_012420 [Mythimna loreyi]|uniref:Uncharacterized protein n=1 Tax=Mythimna loreyi TaxID=667449 RepID=A0ACC2Q074_9NEOP|nr:hypothetical protein PYW08_012420 [Mythimna loreyi]